MKQAIRTDDDARAYLTATGREGILSYLVETETGPALRFSARCGRCGGSGRGPWIQDGGVCYECRGADTRNRTRTVSLKAYAQGERRRDTAAAKRQADRQAAAEFQRAAGEAFLAARPELAAALKVESPLLADLAERLARWGSLSDAQVALALRVAGELKARQDAPKAACPTGRFELAGEVVSVKWRDSGFGGAWKVTVKVSTPEGEWRTWGTLPAALLDAARAEGLTAEGLRGRAVRFTATVEPSDDDPNFGFFQRPTKGELLPAAEAA